MNSKFVKDISEIRNRTRQHMASGPVTDGYKLNIENVCKILNEALSTEIVCVLRYRRHHFMARGIHADSVAKEFLAHSNEEQEHADRIASRICQLGGEPNLNPNGMLNRSHAEYKEGKNLNDMIKEDLIAERIAIDTYREMIKYFGDADSTTRRMLEDILANEEEHADELSKLLDND